MATQAQINANRKNALKSTGPKTPEGKRVISQNALKHGLFAQEAVIYGEESAEYELHREVLLDEWRPVGPTESILAERIVSLTWRMLRAERLQNQAMDCMILREVVGQSDSDLERSYTTAYGVSPDDLETSDEYLPLGRITTRWMDNSKLIERLFMHERRIESSLHRTMTYLKKLQIMRRVEHDDAEGATTEAGTPCRDTSARASRGHLVRDLAHTSQSNAHASEQQSSPETNLAHDGDFAKQSQFDPALMGTKPLMEKFYGNTTRPDSAGNKANQRSFQRPDRPRRPGIGDAAEALRAQQ
jgi:hypothetical protein